MHSYTIIETIFILILVPCLHLNPLNLMCIFNLLIVANRLHLSCTKNFDSAVSVLTISLDCNYSAYKLRFESDEVSCDVKFSYLQCFWFKCEAGWVHGYDVDSSYGFCYHFENKIIPLENCYIRIYCKIKVNFRIPIY